MVRRASPRGKTSLSGFRQAFLLVASVTLTLLTASPGTALADGGRPGANPAQEAAATIRPAVMFVVAQASGQVRLPGGQILSQFGEGLNLPFSAVWSCTGFVVHPDGWVATAGHCADPASAKEQLLNTAAPEYRAQFPDAPESRDPAAALAWLKQNARVEGDTPDHSPAVNLMVMYGTGTKLAAKMLATVVDFRPTDKGDLALLKVEKHNMPSSLLATDAEVAIGTPILAVGFPQSTGLVTDPTLDPTNKSGTVSKKSTRKSVPEYEIDAPVSDGMSGGPTIALDGKVIGVNSFGPTGEPQAFNFIAPADGLAVLLAAKGIKATLGPADVSYRKGLRQYYSGHYSDAIVEFDRTLAMSPDYPGLADLRTSAVNLRQQYGDASTFGRTGLIWYLAGGIILVIAVAAGFTLLVLRMQPSSPGATVADAMGAVGDKESSAAKATVERVRLQAVPQAATEPHFCANCGAEHHPAERFCPNCGHKVLVGESA